MSAPVRRTALAYSIPSMLFGAEKSRSSARGMPAFKAAKRALAKDCPASSSRRRASRKAGGSSRESRAAAKKSSAFPHSHPKASFLTAGMRERMFMAPAANVSAFPAAKETGSSRTASAPPRTACAARVCLSKTAASPRCTKFPLIRQNSISHPDRARISSNWRRWPLWKGLYSQMTAHAVCAFCLSFFFIKLLYNWRKG